MKALILTAITSLFLISAPSVAAQTSFSRYSKEVRAVKLESDEVVERDYFAYGDTVEIYGTVNGDVYVGGGEIIIDGTINGDLLAAGGSVNISGTITQDVRVAGGDINISADIGRNLTVVAGNVDIGESAKIAGSVVLGAGNVNLAAPIEGNIMAGVGSLTIANAISGDVEAGVGQLRLTSRAKVGGNLIYFSDQEASIAKNATVSGQITRNEPSAAVGIADFEIPKKEADNFLAGVRQSARVFSFLTSLVVGLLLIHFYPNYSLSAANTIRKKPWLSLGVGFAILILTPIALFIIGITIIGIPIALILLAGYLIYLYLAKLFVVLRVGTIVAEKAGRKMKLGWTFVLGLIIYHLIILIPGVGVFVRVLALFLGFGGMLLASREAYFAARKKGVI